MERGYIIRSEGEIQGLSSSQRDENLRFFRKFFLDNLFKLTDSFANIVAPSLASEIGSGHDMMPYYTNLIRSYNIIVGIIKSDEKRYLSFPNLSTFYDGATRLVGSMSFMEKPDSDFERNYPIFVDVFKSFLGNIGFNITGKVKSIIDALSNQVLYFSQGDVDFGEDKSQKRSGGEENLKSAAFEEKKIELGVRSNITDLRGYVEKTIIPNLNVAHTTLREENKSFKEYKRRCISYKRMCIGFIEELNKFVESYRNIAGANGYIQNGNSVIRLLGGVTKANTPKNIKDFENFKRGVGMVIIQLDSFSKNL